MSKYGAEYGRWAPFDGNEPEAAKPNYGAAISLGPLNKANDSPSFASGDLYGDNVLKHHVDRFSKGTLTYTSTNLPLPSAAAIYGAQIDAARKEVSYGSDDAPLGGLAFFCELDDEVSGQTVYRGIFYPKVKAQMSGEEFETTGENITFAPDAINFTLYLANYGKWKVTRDCGTAAEAKAWVDACFAASDSSDG